MNPIRKSLAVATLGLPVLLAGQAHAVVVAFDSFENGPSVGQTSTKGNDAFDSTDLAWFSSLDFGTASLQNDSFAGGGSLKALQLSSPDTFRRLTAAFPTTTLGANAGDQLVLSFDMRLTEAPTSNQVGFRFGLFNSAGTSIASDNPNGVNQPTQQNDDFGYVVKISTGTPTALENSITDESAGNNPTGGTVLAGETVLGSAVSPISINDQLKHTFSLTLERVGPSLISLSFVADGILKTTALDATPFLTFDTIHIAQGNVSTDFRIDNVRVETLLAAAAVPEPATLSLAALGMVALMRRRHVRA